MLQNENWNQNFKTIHAISCYVPLLNPINHFNNLGAHALDVPFAVAIRRKGRAGQAEVVCGLVPGDVPPVPIRRPVQQEEWEGAQENSWKFVSSITETKKDRFISYIYASENFKVLKNLQLSF